MFSQLWFLFIVPGLPMGALLFWMHRTIKKRDAQSRRPFDEMPRPAGYSLQKRTDEIWESISDSLMLCLITGVAAWAVLLSDRKLFWIPIVLGLLITSFFALRAWRQVLRLANHRLGLLGEQLVGQILDRACSDTVRVFHDLEIIEPGKKPWNIDHVVLTTAGVFTIETKTRRKPKALPAGGQKGHQVIFDGQQLLFPAPMQADRHGLDQAQGNASWLASKLTALNGSPIPVSPVLVLPGWWVEAKGKGPVAVFNPKSLPSFFKGRAAVLTSAQFNAINAQLEERCRIDLTR
jgi:Nuclease-related domain